MLKPRSTRLSILFTVIGFTPQYMLETRRALYFFAWIFGVAEVIRVVQMIWVCEKGTTWKVSHIVIFNACLLTAVSQTTPTPQCPLGLAVAITHIISTPSLRSLFLVSSVF